MGDKVYPNDNDKHIAKHGIMLQYETMYDEETRKKFQELGIEKFLNYTISLRASNLATIRHYSNIVHLKVK